eukprot:ctg_1625.g372
MSTGTHLALSGRPARPDAGRAGALLGCVYAGGRGAALSLARTQTGHRAGAADAVAGAAQVFVHDAAAVRAHHRGGAGDHPSAGGVLHLGDPAGAGKVRRAPVDLLGAERGAAPRGGRRLPHPPDAVADTAHPGPHASVPAAAQQRVVFGGVAAGRQRGHTGRQSVAIAEQPARLTRPAECDAPRDHRRHVAGRHARGLAAGAALQPPFSADRQRAARVAGGTGDHPQPGRALRGRHRAQRLPVSRDPQHQTGVGQAGAGGHCRLSHRGGGESARAPASRCSALGGVARHARAPGDAAARAAALGAGRRVSIARAHRRPERLLCTDRRLRARAIVSAVALQDAHPAGWLQVCGAARPDQPHVLHHATQRPAGVVSAPLVRRDHAALSGERRARPAGAPHQNGAVPLRQRLAGGAGADRGCATRRRCERAGGAQGQLRRGSERAVRAHAARGRLQRGVRRQGLQDARQAHLGLYRPLPLHLQPGHLRRRDGSIQRVHRVQRQAHVPQTAGVAGEHVGSLSAADPAGGGCGARWSSGPHHLSVQRPDGGAHHAAAVRGEHGRRAHRYGGARGVSGAAGRARRERQHPRGEPARSLSVARAGVLLCQRAGRGSAGVLYRLGGLALAQPVFAPGGGGAGGGQVLASSAVAPFEPAAERFGGGKAARYPVAPVGRRQRLVGGCATAAGGAQGRLRAGACQSKAGGGLGRSHRRPQVRGAADHLDVVLVGGQHRVRRGRPRRRHSRGARGGWRARATGPAGVDHLQAEAAHCGGHRDAHSVRDAAVVALG